MELTLEQALKGKATQIKGKEYLSTEAYITPFLERMSKFTDDFRIQAIPADQISISEDNEDIVYNRMWIQAVMPDDCGYDNHDRVVGLVYGLDTRKPVSKLYVGGLNRACCNLCVFSPSFLNVQELTPESAIDFRPIKHLLEQTSNVKNILTELANTEVPYDESLINENLGRWVRNTMEKQFTGQFGKVKVATSVAIDAFNLLYRNSDSPYYVNPGYSTDMFNVYNAFTQVLTDDTRDIINKCEKTLLTYDIITQ